MMTKIEELNLVNEIFAGFEKGSYIEMTLRGVDKIIKENINNDWGCNIVEDLEGYSSKAKDLQKQLDIKAVELETTIKYKDKLVKEKEEIRQVALQQEKTIHELEIELKQEKMLIAKQSLEIMELKVKLYDMMTNKK